MGARAAEGAATEAFPEVNLWICGGRGGAVPVRRPDQRPSGRPVTCGLSFPFRGPSYSGLRFPQATWGGGGSWGGVRGRRAPAGGGISPGGAPVGWGATGVGAPGRRLARSGASSVWV